VINFGTEDRPAEPFVAKSDAVIPVTSLHAQDIANITPSTSPVFFHLVFRVYSNSLRFSVDQEPLPSASAPTVLPQFIQPFYFSRL
jgi:hypothetical protein